MQRREINQEGREALYLRATEETPVPEPAQRWQDEVRKALDASKA
jgi:chloramphenicol 3-O phosphotransferase